MCVCECTVCVPVCLSSPHEKFQPSKLTSVEVTDIWVVCVCVCVCTGTWVHMYVWVHCISVYVPVCLSSQHENFQPSSVNRCWSYSHSKLTTSHWLAQCRILSLANIIFLIYFTIVYMSNKHHIKSLDIAQHWSDKVSQSCSALTLSVSWILLSPDWVTDNALSL